LYLIKDNIAKEKNNSHFQDKDNTQEISPPLKRIHQAQKNNNPRVVIEVEDKENEEADTSQQPIITPPEPSPLPVKIF
jgi:hypothetical protein